MSWPKFGQFESAHRTRLVTPACYLLLASVLCMMGCTHGPTYPGGFPVGGVPPTAVAPPPANISGQPGTAALQAPTTGPASVYAQQQTNPQLVELQRRVQQLDENNRQLTTQVAQAQQQAQAYRERSELLARQLDDASEQNRQLLAAARQYATQTQGMQASLNQMQQSMQARGGARLTANNSLQSNGSDLQIAGAKVLDDGNLVRIRLPSDQLFAPGTAQLNSSSYMVLAQVASALKQRYPRQRTSIEGHTDTSQVYGGVYTTGFELAGAQAQSVMNQLVQSNGVPMQQLFFIAHGPNHPVADNQTPAGRAENRRIEVVIYPDTY